MNRAHSLRIRSSIACVALLSASLASSSCRSAYYSTMEAFGVHKREILVDRVEDGREAQVEAQEQFKTTLEVFQELTGFDGGDLQKLYDSLEKQYERSEQKAAAVSSHIESIEKVAKDLFAEWRGEIAEIESSDLKARSESMLEDTESRYEQLVAKMREAEVGMAPVLRTFRDHVLFLKHSLNAQSVDALRATAVGIEEDVRALVMEMQESIEEAKEFISAMES